MGASLASAQSAGTPAAPRTERRPPAPLRDPHTPGYVKATELPDGQVPPVEAEGNFIIGPTHVPAPEMSSVGDGMPKGTIYKFTLHSTESSFYPGIARDQPAPGTPVPAVFVGRTVTSHPAPWTRTVSVYVPRQYVPGTVAPFMITCDGDGRAFNVLDHLIPQKKVPVMIVVAIPNGGGDAQGSERGLEYDTVSGKYSDFVETEVLPMAEKVANVKLTKDPDGRATMGTSSGGSCALIMAWFHPDAATTGVPSRSPGLRRQPAMADRSRRYPRRRLGILIVEALIPGSPAKPLRIYLECGDRDNFISRDGMHDWVQANENMAKVLAAKGYLA